MRGVSREPSERSSECALDDEKSSHAVCGAISSAVCGAIANARFSASSGEPLESPLKRACELGAYVIAPFDSLFTVSRNARKAKGAQGCSQARLPEVGEKVRATEA